MNIVRMAASAAMIAILMTCGASAKPIAATRDTNLRKEPRTDSEILTLVPKGTKVDVGQCANGWCKVSWNGQDGYIIVQNLALASIRPPGVVAREAYGAPEPYPPAPAYGPPAYGPPPYGPPAYGYAPYYGSYYGPYAYYGGWGYRGWGWRY